MLRRINLKSIFSNENNKTVLSNALAAFLVKGGALIISLLTMPAYIKYFNDQQVLGMWFTILSVLTWILTFDFGIGNGLRNHLVHAFVSKNTLLAKKYISSAYFVIGLLVILILSFMTIVIRFINWHSVFNIPINIVSKDILITTVYIVFVGILIQFFLKMITSILYALQKSALNNLLNLVSSISILFYVSLAKSTDIETNLILLALVHVLAVNIPLLITTILIFSTTLKKSKPNLMYVRKKHTEEIMKLGGVFFWVQIMYMLITATNEFLITWLSGTEMVVEYQIYNRLFSLIGTIFILGLTPIWSAVTKAISEGNFTWIKKLYNILKILSILAVLLEFSIIPFLQLIINIWLGENILEVSYFNAIVFALFGSIFIWSGVLSSIANGFGELKAQSIFFTIGVIIKIPLAWILVDFFESWIGVIIANIIALSLYCVIQPIWLSKFLNQKELGDELNV